MEERTTVLLVHGAVGNDGLRHREAELCALTGQEEALLAACPGRLTPADCATALLAAATRRIGGIAPVSAEMVAGLTVGDRERMLLSLTQLTLGETIELVLPCPAACGAMLEIELRPGALLDAPADPEEPEHVIWTGTAEGRWRVRFRLPNGHDQQAAARAADPALALIAGCILECRDPAGMAITPAEAASRFAAPLGNAFEQLDPFAETVAAITCTSCGAEGAALIDGFAILHAGLGRGEGLFADTYRMARAYHWSEREIHALPIARRKRYLALADQIAA
jgi:hypothetical protein